MRCPLCKLENPPEAEKCDCGYSFVNSRPEAPASAAVIPGSANVPHAEGFRIFGIILILLGLLIGAGYFLVYETSVAGAEGSRITNVGLMSNRQNGIIFGMDLSIIGGLLLLYGKEG